jgi:hypothetical protein
MSMKQVGRLNNSIQHDPSQNPRESPTAISNNDNDNNDVMVNDYRVVTEGVLQIVLRSEDLFSSGLL